VSRPYNITGKIDCYVLATSHFFDRRLEDKIFLTETQEISPECNLTFSNNIILKNFSGFQLLAQNFITDL
jgi:hypothetical protein